MYVKLTKIQQEESIFHDGLTQILFLIIIIVVWQKDETFANVPIRQLLLLTHDRPSLPNYLVLNNEFCLALKILVK